MKDALLLLPGLTSAARQIGNVLLKFYNKDNGRCDPGQTRLADLSGLNPRTVTNAINELCADPVLLFTRKTHGGFSHRNQYIPNFARAREFVSRWERCKYEREPIEDAKTARRAKQSTQPEHRKKMRNQGRKKIRLYEEKKYAQTLSENPSKETLTGHEPATTDHHSAKSEPPSSLDATEPQLNTPPETSEHATPSANTGDPEFIRASETEKECAQAELTDSSKTALPVRNANINGQSTSTNADVHPSPSSPVAGEPLKSLPTNGPYKRVRLEKRLLPASTFKNSDKANAAREQAQQRLNDYFYRIDGGLFTQWCEIATPGESNYETAVNAEIRRRGDGIRMMKEFLFKLEPR